MKPTLTLLLLFAFVLSACRKEQTPDPITAKTALLTAGPWHMTEYRAWTMLGDYDYYAGYPDCRKDDLKIFLADGSGSDDEGPTKCDPSDPQSRSFTWKVENKIFYAMINNIQWRVEKLEDHQLMLYRKATYDEFRMTYEH